MVGVSVVGTVVVGVSVVGTVVVGTVVVGTVVVGVSVVGTAVEGVCVVSGALDTDVYQFGNFVSSALTTEVGAGLSSTLTPTNSSDGASIIILIDEPDNLIYLGSSPFLAITGYLMFSAACNSVIPPNVPINSSAPANR